MVTDSFTYYYMALNKKSIDDLYAVLTPLHGDFELYMNYQRDYKDFQNWTLPSKTNYEKKSIEKLKTEMIHLT